MSHAPFYLMIIAFVILLGGMVMAGGRQSQSRIVVDCSAWPSIEDCLRDGFAYQWEQVPGFDVIGPIEGAAEEVE